MLRVTAHLAAGPTCIHCPAVAPVGGNEVYVFGVSYTRETDGLNGDQMEVYVFNTVALRWRTLPHVTLTQGGERPPEAPPVPVIFHTAVLIGCVVYVFGGCTQFSPLSEYHNALHTFDVVAHSWSRPEVSGSVPRGRNSHSACASEKVMYVFGGYARDQQGRLDTNRDVLRLDTSTMVWSLVSVRGTPPPEPNHNCATFIGTKMFVFGGFEDTCDSLSVFDMETNVWLRTPPDRLCPIDLVHSKDFLRNGELYVFESNYVVKYTPETSLWKRMKPKGKTVCWTDGMSLCTVGDRIVLFGGPDPVCRGYDRPGFLYILDFNPSLKTLCKLTVIQYGLEQSELPHDVRWELAAMTTNSS